MVEFIALFLILVYVRTSHIFFVAQGNGIRATKGIVEVYWQQATFIPVIVRAANVLVTRDKKEKKNMLFTCCACSQNITVSQSL